MLLTSRYNLFKLLSLIITIVPITISTLSYGPIIVQTTNASISFAGLIGVIILLLIFKDKLSKYKKNPTVFVISLVIVIFIILVEHILVPIKGICMTTAICTGIDELTFKRIYTKLEMRMPENHDGYKHFGFYFCRAKAMKK